MYFWGGSMAEFCRNFWKKGVFWLKSGYFRAAGVIAHFPHHSSRTEQVVWWLIYAEIRKQTKCAPYEALTVAKMALFFVHHMVRRFLRGLPFAYHGVFLMLRLKMKFWKTPDHMVYRVKNGVFWQGVVYGLSDDRDMPKMLALGVIAGFELETHHTHHVVVKHFAPYAPRVFPMTVLPRPKHALRLPRFYHHSTLSHRVHHTGVILVGLAHCGWLPARGIFHHSGYGRTLYLPREKWLFFTILNSAYLGHQMLFLSIFYILHNKALFVTIFIEHTHQ